MWTEDEAKTKWCPMARNLVTVSQRADGAPCAAAAINRGKDSAKGEIKTRCIASDCMMWRWSTQLGNGIGYCGLAGQQI